MDQNESIENQWKALLLGLHPGLRRGRHFFSLLPSEPRCKLCNAPFAGVGGASVKVLFNKKQAVGNPNFCNFCDDFARNNPGGAEIELTLLFADVRGSTTLAEKMSPSEFSRLMSRFYGAATQVLTRSDAFINKIVGDEVVAHYYPGFAGSNHAARAISAAEALLEATGHARESGPWLPVGVAVHTGVAFVGVMKSYGVMEFTALGDVVNTAARIAGHARQGEILVSKATCDAAGIGFNESERRTLELKGKTEPVDVKTLGVGRSPAAK